MVAELRSASEVVTETERVVIRLVIMERWTQGEAAKHLGMSQPGVCRMLREALHKLRETRNLVIDDENF